jgi:hypothetical protein
MTTSKVERLAERCESTANALIVLRQGVTADAVGALPPCDPVTVADLLEEAAQALRTQQEPTDGQE